MDSSITTRRRMPRLKINRLLRLQQEKSLEQALKEIENHTEVSFDLNCINKFSFN